MATFQSKIQTLAVDNTKETTVPEVEVKLKTGMWLRSLLGIYPSPDSLAHYSGSRTPNF
jgi:hypothetical protein